ncbi:hypothetical protein K5D34_07535 [Pseudomonas cichorii]|nr:hypothetical protein [Pseudomonas cichorii]MBX8509525.1 hypothetical protein [Pseudomonas cichorii]MBX8524386.1 hypothetical protein [Pseudomonas cichorii]MBX8591148.1 hypothetical protein [Pseudomonas cichorii]
MNTFISASSERWHMCRFGLLRGVIVADSLDGKGHINGYKIKRIYIQIRRRIVYYRQT